MSTALSLLYVLRSLIDILVSSQRLGRSSGSICSRSVSIDNIEDLQIRHGAVFSRRATAKLLFQLVASIRRESADRVGSNLAGRPSVLIGGIPRHVLGDGHVLRESVAVHESHLVICWNVIAVDKGVVRMSQADGRVQRLGGLFATLQDGGTGHLGHVLRSGCCGGYCGNGFLVGIRLARYLNRNLRRCWCWLQLTRRISHHWLAPIAWSAWRTISNHGLQHVCRSRSLRATGAINFDLRNSIGSQQVTQASILLSDTLCCCLQFSRGRNANLLAVAISRLQFLEVVLPPGARSSLVVADPSQIRSFLRVAIFS